MSFKKRDDGRYLVMVRPDGASGKNIRRIVKTRSEAVRLERELLSHNSSDLDSSRLSTLVTYWFDHFGVNLKDGEARRSKLDNIVEAIGDKKYSSFRASDFVVFRKKRLDSGISKNTANHDLAYFKTVLNKLHKLGVISENKVAGIAPLKFDQVEFSYLSSYQIKRLLVCCRNSRNESLFPVVFTILATGARWSEVEQLTFSQVYNKCVRFTKTKSLKSRTVPLSPSLYNYLLSRKGRTLGGRVFANCYDAFSNAVTNSRIVLPDGQLTHVLRHTFASHFVINGGSIFDLQKLLGHSDPRVTMRYAHLAPDHLIDAVRLNPVASFSF